MDPDLTPKQLGFVERYLVHWNATQAAIDAGYSPDSARSIGQENLMKPAIARAITAAIVERTERNHFDADMVLARLVVEAVREGPGSSHGARVKALELLGKQCGLFKDQLDLNVLNNLSPEQVEEEARRRGLDRPARG